MSNYHTRLRSALAMFVHFLIVAGLLGSMAGCRHHRAPGLSNLVDAHSLLQAYAHSDTCLRPQE